jgi:hypothetical protein
MWRKLLPVLTLSLLALVGAAFAFKPKEISADVIAASVNRDATLLARARLYAAVDTRDGEHKRGLLRIE